MTKSSREEAIDAGYQLHPRGGTAMRRKLGTVAVVVAIAVQLDAQSVDHAPAPPTPPWGTPASDWAPETGLMHFDPDPNGIASRFTGVDDLLGVGADLAFGGEVEAQYYGEWMAAPPTLPPLTESMDYDIHGDAKTARGSSGGVDAYGATREFQDRSELHQPLRAILCGGARHRSAVRQTVTNVGPAMCGQLLFASDPLAPGQCLRLVSADPALRAGTFIASDPA